MTCKCISSCWALYISHITKYFIGAYNNIARHRNRREKNVRRENILSFIGLHCANIRTHTFYSIYRSYYVMTCLLHKAQQVSSDSFLFGLDKGRLRISHGGVLWAEVFSVVDVVLLIHPVLSSCSCVDKYWRIWACLYITWSSKGGWWGGLMTMGAKKIKSRKGVGGRGRVWKWSPSAPFPTPFHPSILKSFVNDPNFYESVAILLAQSKHIGNVK